MIKKYDKSDGSRRLSANFRVAEFACKCGRCDRILIDDTLVTQLQSIRDHFRAVVNINSGYRCAAHNAEVGGDPNSSHMDGMAADIVVKDIQPAEVAKYAESIGIKRIGLYDDFVHIGSGQTKRFWKGKTGTAVETFGAAQSFTVELPVLRRGSRGEAVKALQAQLLGYGYSLAVDGSYGPTTEAVVKKYQSDRKITVTGIGDEQTRKKMLGI